MEVDLRRNWEAFMEETRNEFIKESEMECDGTMTN